MPDTANYNTRLRTNSLILPPRRLRPSPSPPPRHRLAKNRTAELPQPLFPPPNVVLHPDDATNKTFLAIGRALLAVENRAITIKDLSHLILDYGLLCQNASAASQAITNFIRNHLNRCHQDRSRPLLLSLPLTGTTADDRLAPALHSRSGGTSVVKDSSRTLTSFRRGTTVWYLSDSAGASCPFQRAGLSIQEITNPAAKGTKRKRGSHHVQPRKLSTPGPAMATRHRAPPDPNPAADTDTATPATSSRLRVRLTLKPRDPPPPSPSLSSSDDASQSDLTDVESLSSLDAVSHTERSSLSPDNFSDSDSSIHVDVSDSLPASSMQLPPYPILSPSIPSPSCSTPTTSLASPSCSDPFAPYRSTLCSGHLKSSFLSFRTALSNPPPDHRARSSSLPFSAASPPPDSEDEDEDYHNSMVGLRRGSVPIPMKQEEDSVSKCEPVVPCSTNTWDLHQSLKQEHSQEDVSTPLELLPGFVSFSPESDHVAVKDEPTSAVLPPDADWGHVSIKPEPSKGKATLDPEDDHRQLQSVGTGTREDPVRIDTVVHDIEVLGPESLISREWDAAWSSGVNVDVRTDNSMDVDPSVPLPRSCTPLSDAVFARRSDPDLRASPAATLLTASTSISSPPSNDPVPMDSDHEAPILMHPLRPCDPPVVATVIEGVPVYYTLIASGVPFLRRIDTSFVNLTPLMTMLGLPLSALVSYTHATPRMTVSRAPEPIGGTWVPLAVAQGVTRHAGAGKIPPSLLDVFLSVDLGMWFPDALVRLVQLHANTAAAINIRPENVPAAMREVGIRVEDVFVGAGCVEFKQDARLKPDVFELQPLPVRTGGGVLSRGSSLFFEQARSACASISMPMPLNEQEEDLFHSFVDMLGTGVSASSSPLSSAPSSPIVKSAVTSAVTAMTSSANEKENTVRSENAPPPPAAAVVRRKREKAAVPELPVRRSKRALAKASVPVTRSRTRTSSEGRVAG